MVKDKLLNIGKDSQLGTLFKTVRKISTSYLIII